MSLVEGLHAIRGVSPSRNEVGDVAKVEEGHVSEGVSNDVPYDAVLRREVRLDRSDLQRDWFVFLLLSDVRRRGLDVLRGLRCSRDSIVEVAAGLLLIVGKEGRRRGCRRCGKVGQCGRRHHPRWCVVGWGQDRGNTRHGLRGPEQDHVGRW